VAPGGGERTARSQLRLLRLRIPLSPFTRFHMMFHDRRPLETPLSVRPEDIALNSKHGTEVFLECYRDFYCLNLSKVLSLLYTSPRTTCSADLVEKSVGWYRQMIAHEQSNGRVATNAHTSGWHLWTVIIPRRSISGKLVVGQVWRRRHGTKWAYKKFVEYADRDITGSGARREAPIR
jgi:hypothetical protein